MEFDPLETLFEKGFRIRKQRTAKAVRTDRYRYGDWQPVPSSGVKFSGGAKSANVRAVIKRSPEVVVKITGHSNGLNSVKHHLDYISRNGQVELEDERGTILAGKGAIKELREQLKATQFPAESKRREFLHILFSMPPGTPEKGFKDAVRNFCQEEFLYRQYVMTIHRDTDHMHAHVCVSTRNLECADEPRLSPRKADLTRWRLGFADKLRQQDIEAAASKRSHRFKYRKAENAVVRQIRADNPASPVYNARRAKGRAEMRAIRAVIRPDKAFIGPPRPARTPSIYKKLADELQVAINTGKRPENPAQAAIEKSRAEALKVWRTVTEELASRGDPLADDVKQLLREGEKPVVSRMQELYDVARANKRVKYNENEI